MIAVGKIVFAKIHHPAGGRCSIGDGMLFNWRHPNQMGWMPPNFVATSTSRIMAVLRIVPQIVRIASVTVGCSSASNSNRPLTSLSVNAGEQGIRFGRSGPEPVIQREPRSTGTR